MKYFARIHLSSALLGATFALLISPLSIAAKDMQAKIAELQVVDCLLPGQTRMIGGRAYITPRRPTKTTAADCQIRGGEYVAYDRADYKTALNVWIAAAEAGDATAQVNVGEIFEQGAGGEANYPAAVIWYKKAAEQGNARAQFNLGTLYEQGKGVEKNQLEALNLYRKAWGLPEDSVMFQSAAATESEAQRKALEKTIKRKDTQIKALNSQIDTLAKELSASANGTELSDELASLRELVKELQDDKKSSETSMQKIAKYRSVATDPKAGLPLTAQNLSAEGITFGKYYALVIANQHYSLLDDLISPINDAQKIADVLSKKYGFSVQTLFNADNIEIMQAINNLNEKLTDNDNLVIYYAGHGNRIAAGDYTSGYWLPSNAEPPPKDTFWVANEFVTRHLSRLNAKRVLVISDSCYAGLLSDAPGYLFTSNNANFDFDYVRYKLPKASRLLLSSGGDQPILDNAGNGQSVFSNALLAELDANDSVLSSPELFLRLRNKVAIASQKLGLDQTPEFKAIKGAGHEVGDFFFVPKAIWKQ
ncbi:caspase family protein [Teredinibacter waterburyi]|uniref:caspase family protein n=1 Tax=Teredinibacter waterburyi TaxID=1500538 RepID=UPI001FE490B4|nr:caspase family protein [Teredinibacter waterburyi]